MYNSVNYFHLHFRHVRGKLSEFTFLRILYSATFKVENYLTMNRSTSSADQFSDVGPFVFVFFYFPPKWKVNFFQHTNTYRFLYDTYAVSYCDRWIIHSGLASYENFLLNAESIQDDIFSIYLSNHRVVGWMKRKYYKFK